MAKQEIQQDPGIYDFDGSSSVQEEGGFGATNRVSASQEGLSESRVAAKWESSSGTSDMLLPMLESLLTNLESMLDLEKQKLESYTSSLNRIKSK